MSLKKKFRNFVQSKYIVKIIALLKKGTSPRELAIAVAVTFVLGLFPVLGSTTILCTAFALMFRLNLPLVHLINYSVYPLQLVMLIPFMKLGEIIFQFENLSYGFEEVVELISNDVFNAISVLWNVTLQGIGAWLIIAPVVSYTLYLILHPAFRRIGKSLDER